MLTEFKFCILNGDEFWLSIGLIGDDSRFFGFFSLLVSIENVGDGLFVTVRGFLSPFILQFGELCGVKLVVSVF